MNRCLLALVSSTVGINDSMALTWLDVHKCDDDTRACARSSKDWTLFPWHAGGYNDDEDGVDGAVDGAAAGVGGPDMLRRMLKLNDAAADMLTDGTCIRDQFASTA